MKNIRRRIAAAALTLLFAGCSEDPKIAKLGEQLRRMDSDTKVGVALKDYGDRLRDLNFAYEEVKSAKVGPDKFREEAGQAVDNYKDAGEIWAMKISAREENIFYGKAYSDPSKSYWQFASDEDDITPEDVGILNAIIKERKILVNRKKATLDDALQDLWALAKEHSEKALDEVK